MEGVSGPSPVIKRSKMEVVSGPSLVKKSQADKQLIVQVVVKVKDWIYAGYAIIRSKPLEEPQKIMVWNPQFESRPLKDLCVGLCVKLDLKTQVQDQWVERGTKLVNFVLNIGDHVMRTKFSPLATEEMIQELKAICEDDAELNTLCSITRSMALWHGKDGMTGVGLLKSLPRSLGLQNKFKPNQTPNESTENWICSLYDSTVDNLEVRIAKRPNVDDFLDWKKDDPIFVYGSQVPLGLPQYRDTLQIYLDRQQPYTAKKLPCESVVGLKSSYIEKTTGTLIGWSEEDNQDIEIEFGLVACYETISVKISHEDFKEKFSCENAREKLIEWENEDPEPKFLLHQEHLANTFPKTIVCPFWDLLPADAVCDKETQRQLIAKEKDAFLEAEANEKEMFDALEAEQLRETQV